ncbi:hypothetical protein ACQ4M4_19240 [Leptolyngbya sp. AN02str]
MRIMQNKPTTHTTVATTGETFISRDRSAYTEPTISRFGDVLDVWLLVVEGVHRTPSTTNNHTFETPPAIQ